MPPKAKRAKPSKLVVTFFGCHWFISNDWKLAVETSKPEVFSFGYIVRVVHSDKDTPPAPVNLKNVYRVLVTTVQNAMRSNYMLLLGYYLVDRADGHISINSVMKDKSLDLAEKFGM